MQVIIHSEKDLGKVADEILALSKEAKVVLLKGDLGAGKTTLVKRVAQILKSSDTATSPTYSLINEYKIPNGFLYHMDLYRLNALEEALDIGIEDYLYSNQLCFIEWPAIINELLPTSYIEVEIEKLADNSRKFTIFKR